MTSATPAPPDDDGPADWRDVARREWHVAIETRLLHAVVGLFVLTFAITAVLALVLSAQFFTTADLQGVATLISQSAAWLYGSLLALVGLFAGLAAADRTRGDGPARATVPGTLAATGAVVGGGVTVGLAVLLLIALVAFDPIAPGPALALMVGGVGAALAYVSLGVAIGALLSCLHRAMAAALATYVALVLLWDTWILPLGILVLVTGADLAALGTPPGWFDVLVATSPGGAFGALVAWSVGEVGAPVGVGGLALLAWIAIPPVVAVLLGTDVDRTEAVETGSE